MSNVIPFHERLECSVCQRTYVETPRKTSHKLLSDRRAHVCPECKPQPIDAEIGSDIDAYLADLDHAINSKISAKRYLKFLEALQALGAGSEPPVTP